MSRVLATLQRHLRRKRGRIKRVTSALGVAPGYFRDKRRTGDISLRVLYQALDELRIEPLHFLHEAHADCDLDSQELLETPLGVPSKVSLLGLRRWRSPGDSEFSKTDLHELDIQRDTDPEATARKAKSWLRRADKKAVPYLLAIHGSAQRVLAQLDDALDNLLHALVLAKKMDPLLCGDICLRLGVVHAHRGHLHLGLYFAERATQIFLMEGDDLGVGKGLIDQGMRLSELGQVANSIKATQRALQFLPSDEYRNRFSAFLSLANRYRHIGEVPKALYYLERARPLSPHVGPTVSVKIHWVEAKIAADLGECERAEALYQKVFYVCQRARPVDAALAALDIVRLKLRRGEYAAASKSALTLVSALSPRIENCSPVASAALMELLRDVAAGQITTRRIEEVSQVIQRARANAHAQRDS